MRIESSVELKKVHAKDIMEYLKKHKSCTKKVMAEELNLSFATVSNICNEMREMQYLEETVLDDTRMVGRNPKGISLNYKNLLCLCFDLTMSGIIKAAVIDCGMQMICSELFHYEKDCTVEDIVEECRKVYQEYVLDQFSAEQIIGVGVAVPGIFEKNTHNIVSSEIEIFNNQPLKAMLTEALDKTVYIDNESNLCVFFEYLKEEAAGNRENVIYIFADEGLGIGVVTGGQLVRGSSGYAPEICHMPIGNMQLKCHLCSSMGCVESDLRIQGYVEKYNLYGQEQKIRTFEEFCRLADEQDATAVRVLEENTEILGKLLSILNNMFNPDCIYIGGKTIGILENRIEQSMEQVKTRMLSEKNALPDMCPDQESSITVLKGAAEMVFSQWMPL